LEGGAVEPWVAKALTRKAELETELAEVERFLALGRKLFGTGPEPSDTPGMRKSDPETRTGASKERRLGPPEFADMAERIIKDEGHPMSRTELVAALEARGADLPSDDKPRYLGTIMWRQRVRFVNIPGKGYWLRDEPNEAAGYAPGDIETDDVSQNAELEEMLK